MRLALHKVLSRRRAGVATWRPDERRSCEQGWTGRDAEYRFCERETQYSDQPSISGRSIQPAAEPVPSAYAASVVLVMTLLFLASAAALAFSHGPDSTRLAANAGTHSGAPVAADSLVLNKSRRELVVYYRGYPVRVYYVALGRSPVGDKERIGDNRTPEGLFYIEGRNPNSRYHLSLRISYPDAFHRARAARLGVEPGGDIMIHGLPAEQAAFGPAHRDYDWTNGCIAVTNREIEELWRVIRDGTPIEIKP